MGSNDYLLNISIISNSIKIQSSYLFYQPLKRLIVNSIYIHHKDSKNYNHKELETHYNLYILINAD